MRAIDEFEIEETLVPFLYISMRLDLAKNLIPDVTYINQQQNSIIFNNLYVKVM